MVEPFCVDNFLPVHGPIAIVAHDAGAASHIAAWFSTSKLPLYVYAEGPAKDLFARSFLHNEKSLSNAIDKSSLVVTGTGWASDLEHSARQLACKRNIPTVAVLDHWANYRERFQRDDEEKLPDTLWVADAEAVSLATSCFPKIPIVRLPNQWLNELCSDVLSLRLKQNLSRPQTRLPHRLLYLLEPIRVPWSQGLVKASEPGEFQGLRYWINQLPLLADKNLVAPACELDALKLRPHPSEALGKYDAFISEYSDIWPISLDHSTSLAEALAWSDAVFGCETQALIAAIACNIPSYSSVPPWAPPCGLPHAGLNHLSRLEA